MAQPRLQRLVTVLADQDKERQRVVNVQTAFRAVVDPEQGYTSKPARIRGIKTIKHNFETDRALHLRLCEEHGIPFDAPVDWFDCHLKGNARAMDVQEFWSKFAI